MASGGGGRQSAKDRRAAWQRQRRGEDQPARFWWLAALWLVRALLTASLLAVPTGVVSRVQSDPLLDSAAVLALAVFVLGLLLATFPRTLEAGSAVSAVGLTSALVLLGCRLLRDPAQAVLESQLHPNGRGALTYDAEAVILGVVCIVLGVLPTALWAWSAIGDRRPRSGTRRRHGR